MDIVNIFTIFMLFTFTSHSFTVSGESVGVRAAPACPDAGLVKILGPPRYNRCLTFCARDACISYELMRALSGGNPCLSAGLPRERRQSAPSVCVLPSEHNGKRFPAVRQEQEPLEVDAD